jgi:hypothetical protein
MASERLKLIDDGWASVTLLVEACQPMFNGGGEN